MRKPNRKLVVRRETLRALANAELVHIAGGARLAADTAPKSCAVVADPIAQPPGD